MIADKIKNARTILYYITIIIVGIICTYKKRMCIHSLELPAKGLQKMCGGIVRNVAMNGSQSSMPE